MKLEIERINAYEHLKPWEEIYRKSLNTVIFASPKWAILSAEYTGGEPSFWMVSNGQPLGYFSGSYYGSRGTLILPVFDPIFAPYSDFSVDPAHRGEVLNAFLDYAKANYDNVIVGPIREDSPTHTYVSKMGTPISTVRILRTKLKGDPLEHLYRQRAKTFITAFEGMKKKMRLTVELHDFTKLDDVLTFSYNLSPEREFALKSVLAAHREDVRILEARKRDKVIGYMVLLDTDRGIYVIINTVPEGESMLTIWRYIYEYSRSGVVLEIPAIKHGFVKDLGFKEVKAHIYRL